MDYKRIYDELMQSRLLLKEERIELRKRGEYFEAHHIIPKSMGGGGFTIRINQLSHPNIVVLTGREHYIAHALLWLIYRNKEMACAFNFMYKTTNKNHRRDYRVSSRLYEMLKKDIRNMGTSEETRKKLSKVHLGKKLTPEHREKIRQSNLGRIQPAEAVEKSRQANLGRHHTIEARKKISKRNLGKLRSEEAKEKYKQMRLGKKMSPETKEKLRQINLGNKFSSETIAKRTETFKRNRLLKKLKSTEESFNKHFDGGQGE